MEKFTKDTLNSFDKKNVNVLLRYMKRADMGLRKKKFSHKNTLAEFIWMLNKLTCWRALGKTMELLGMKENHYTTTAKKFRDYANLDVFKNAYKELLYEHFSSQNKKGKKSFNLYIDASQIYNRNGSEKIGIGENKKKRCTKLTVLADNNGLVYGINLDAGNVHDVNTIDPVIDKFIKTLDLNIKNDDFEISVGADKGYIINKEKQNYLKEKKCTIHFPNRKNQKNPTSEKTKQILKERYKIENVINSIKNFSRILVRRDFKAGNYEAFIYLALVLKFKIPKQIAEMSEEEKRFIEHERYKNKLKKEKRRRKREEDKANHIKNKNKKLSIRQKNKEKKKEEKARMNKLKEEIKNLKKEIKTIRSITKSKSKTQNNQNFTYLTTFNAILDTKDLNNDSKIIKLNENSIKNPMGHAKARRASSYIFKQIKYPAMC